LRLQAHKKLPPEYVITVLQLQSRNLSCILRLIRIFH
jgi:hypothetical protein